jgi:hypothetical protein
VIDRHEISEVKVNSREFLSFRPPLAAEQRAQLVSEIKQRWGMHTVYTSSSLSASSSSPKFSRVIQRSLVLNLSKPLGVGELTKILMATKEAIWSELRPLLEGKELNHGDLVQVVFELAVGDEANK